jgi:hypothetical protein
MVYPEFGYLLSQSVGMVPGDEYLLVILDSVGDGVCCGGGYGDGSESMSVTVPAAATGTGLPRFTVILDSVPAAATETDSPRSTVSLIPYLLRLRR